MHNKLAAFALLLAGASGALGQFPAERLQEFSSRARDLNFPTAPSSPSSVRLPQMVLFKPEGPGPFPALVLHHQCGGLGNVRWPNDSMLNWAKEAVGRGYVALLLDSLSQRNADTVCNGPQNDVGFTRGVKDALQAAEYLRKFDFVDKKRVALAGYSWGAMVGALASSKHWRTTLSPGDGFAAVVSFYPGCFTVKPRGGGSYEFVNTDIDRPLLVLMGQNDTETPPGECVPKLEAARAAGSPVQWHVYPGVTHCWDCSHLHGFKSYYYDQNATQDSARRLFEFLQSTFNRQP